MIYMAGFTKPRSFHYSFQGGEMDYWTPFFQGFASGLLVAVGILAVMLHNFNQGWAFCLFVLGRRGHQEYVAPGLHRKKWRMTWT